MAAKRKLFLHIGRHKTGTSAIQEFLLLNRALLLEKGILYPETGMTPTSGQAGLAWCFRYRQDSYEIYQNLYREIDENPDKTVLVSSEGFLEPGVFEDLVFKHLPKKRFDVTIIVYVRRQDSFYESAYKQAVEGAGRACSIQQYKCRQDLLEIIQPWADYYGKENIVVRPYEQQQFFGGGLFSDFMKAVGVESIDDFSVPDRRINPSVTHDMLELIRKVNKISMPMEIRQKFVSDIIEKMQDLETDERPCEYSLISPEERLNLIREYEQSNSQVAKEYMGRKDGVLFRDSLPDLDEEWQPYPGLSLDKAVEVLGSILIQCVQALNETREEAVEKHETPRSEVDLENQDEQEIPPESSRRLNERVRSVAKRIFGGRYRD